MKKIVASASFEGDGRELDGPQNGRTCFHQPGYQALVDICESTDSIWMVIDGARCYYVLSFLLLCDTFTDRRRSHTSFVHF